MPGTREALRDLDEDDRRQIGTDLRQVQQGKHPASEKALSNHGSTNLRELKCDSKGGTYRLIYTIEFREAIWVLDVFKKKSKHGIEVPKEDAARIKARLQTAKSLHAQAFSGVSLTGGKRGKPN